MEKYFRKGQKVIVDFGGLQAGIVVKEPFFSEKSMSTRMEIKLKDGTIIDPVPSIVYNTPIEYYEEHIKFLKNKLKMAKETLKALKCTR